MKCSPTLFTSVMMATMFSVTARGSTEVKSSESLREIAESTCADPNTAITYVQAYSRVGTVHALEPYTMWVGNAVLNGDWVMQNQVLRTWETQQPSTVPLYRLAQPGTNLDYMYARMNSNGTLPSATGYELNADVIYVYPTQICGSVPLYAMHNAAITDHFYSTDPADAGRMAPFGYVDQGIIAYVLPPSCGCN